MQIIDIAGLLKELELLANLALIITTRIAGGLL